MLRSCALAKGEITMFKFFHPLTALERERVIWNKQDNLPDVLSALFCDPLPGADANVNELEYLVLDLETTGLNPEKDQILSIGYVEIKGFKLNLKSAIHTFVQGHQEVKAETAVINHIVPEMLTSGETLDDAMTALFKKMQGKVLIAHGSFMERGFIDHYVLNRYNLGPLPLLWLDTLLIEKSLIRNMDDESDGDYRLASCRERYHLPEYAAHGALIDAVATGELFFALVKAIFAQSRPMLGRIYKNRRRAYTGLG
jgi:DNA polymerase-3 subunit epsilon